MAVELPGGIKGLNPSPTDAWSGPYNSVGEANMSINPLVRYKTMIVRIMSDLYWYRNGTADIDLVLFNGEDCGTYLSTVPLTLALPTKGGVINTNIGSGLAYTVGSSIAVTGTGTSPPIYYVDVTSSTNITFNQAATVDVFMIGGGGSGGAGGGSKGGGGGGGAGAYYYTDVSPISVVSGTTLAITVGAGDTVIANSQTPAVDILRVKAGGAGGSGGAYGSVGVAGGCGGGGGGGGVVGGAYGGVGGAGTGIVFGGGTAYTTGTIGTGGGGGGSGGIGGAAGYGSIGIAGASKTLTVLKDLFTFGSGGKGGKGVSGSTNGAAAAANTGSGGDGGGGSGAGGAGGSGRVILKVKTPVNTNPFTIATAPVSFYADPNITTLYKFEGLVSSYNRTTGEITITNIQNITGSFAGSTAYTFNVNTFNGGNAGTNIEIKDSKVNLSINSDIQMNGKKIVSPTALYLTVPFSSMTASAAVGFMIVNVNGSNYKIALYSR